MTVVIDTNVILVANGQHQGVSEACVLACIRRLDAIRKHGCVAIDADYQIIREYGNKTDANRGKGVGDAFVKWLHQNKRTRARCVQVKLHTHAERGFESFPDDGRLANFDVADRKFVAVAAAHSARPPILQAADSKWVAWSHALKDHGLKVEFLCPEDIQRFDEQKQKPSPKKHRARS